VQILISPEALIPALLAIKSVGDLSLSAMRPNPMSEAGDRKVLCFAITETQVLE
jgi:hypothetical protein